MWLENKSRLVCGIIKQWGTGPPELCFNWTKGPDGGWSNQSLGILFLISLTSDFKECASLACGRCRINCWIPAIQNTHLTMLQWQEAHYW